MHASSATTISRGVGGRRTRERKTATGTGMRKTRRRTKTGMRKTRRKTKRRTTTTIFHGHTCRVNTAVIVEIQTRVFVHPRQGRLRAGARRRGKPLGFPGASQEGKSASSRCRQRVWLCIRKVAELPSTEGVHASTYQRDVDLQVEGEAGERAD